MGFFIEVVYYAALLATLAFSLVQLSLLFIYVFRKRHQRAAPVTLTDWADLPYITVQLPVFNEVYVVDRLIDSIMALQYPADKLDIQILDDSTDETTARIDHKLMAHRRAGYTIEHVRRPDRTGYKAGALAYALPFTRGEYIAIFDADFVPDPDFLLRVMPHFDRPDIGVVQTRWLHLNEDYSILTQLQAMGLNAHFLIEQNARHAGGLFLNFNGTAGVWRKKAIREAGSWQSDTLTEDLDLSYRAQLKGWRIVYRDDVGVPAELPVTMDAIKSQQYRWMKGPAECAQKLLKHVLRAPNVSLGKKIQAVFHLMNSSLFVVMLVMALLSVPVLYGHQQVPDVQTTYSLQRLFLVASIVSLLFWGIPFFQQAIASPSARSVQSASNRLVNALRFLWLYPLFLAVMLGLSLHNSLAVLEGHLGIKTPFVRTPKFNLSNAANDWETNRYVQQPVSWLIVAEIGLAVYFGLGIGIGMYHHNYTMLSFHILLAVGFSLVASYSLIHARSIRRSVADPVLSPVV